MENAAGLNEDQLTILRGRLEQLRADLRRRIQREQSVARESDADQAIEEVDAAEQTREQDDAVRFANHDRDRLDEIERALQKISTGRYGISEVSGEPIPFERLRAVPWARADSDEE
ncbi:MAG TPA: TraR/DksA family transcriptional regulator [Polyangia bacterium]|jgi:DnaK suppressor protein